MRLPATYKWIGLALLGLLIAVAVAIAASNLVSQQIGIASESVSAGDALAPAVSSVGNGGSKQGKPPGDTTGGGDPTTTAPTEPSEPTTGAEPGDDHGSGGSENGGEGSDD